MVFLSLARLTPTSRARFFFERNQNPPWQEPPEAAAAASP
jgi:hypothetical protein